MSAAGRAEAGAARPGRQAQRKQPLARVRGRPRRRTWGPVEEHSAGRRDVEALKQLRVDERQEDHLLEGLQEEGRGWAAEGSRVRGQREGREVAEGRVAEDSA